jgi:hypothetical protein
MKRLISVIAVLLFVSACVPVTVPPAHKGKFLTGIRKRVCTSITLYLIISNEQFGL